MTRDALVVGISTYEFEQFGKLQAPSNDAEAIAQLLEQYGEFKVRRLPGIIDRETRNPRVGKKTKVTLKDLEQAIAQLFKPDSRQIPDTALLYFSGHGLRKNLGIEEGFLATSDVNPDLSKWGLSLRWLRELLQASEVRQQIIWLDCCYSGNILSIAEANPGYTGRARDRCFIAASRAYEEAFEKEEHGVLTAALLEGLKPQGNGWVTNHSLVHFLNRQRHSFPQHLICHNSGEAINFTHSYNAPITEPASDSKEPICPYKGLAYFDCKEEDAKYFYGRTDLTDRLLEEVRCGNFLAVLGASGSGKSSVVRAGLLYQLKLGRRLLGSDRWRIHIFTPGERPLDNLATALIDPKLSEADRAKELATIQQLFKDNPLEGLGYLITATESEKVVLVVDQFEEAFTLCNNSELRQQFFACLLGALERPDKKLCLVLTMRADFFGKCAEKEYAGLAKKIQANLVTVTPMKPEELEKAITKPAEQVKLEIEPGLISYMIDEMNGAPGSLPLLQYTLTELWNQRHENKLTIAAYTKLGGVKGTLQERATKVYDSLSPDQQKTAKRIFLELTQLGEGTEDTRRRVLQQDLVTSEQSAALVNQVVKKLADANLIVTSTLLEKGAKSGQIPVVDIAHESLIRHWSQLRQWVNESRDAIRIKHKIEQAAKEWESYGKSTDIAFLLQGARLTEAENFLENNADVVILSGVAQALIAVSKAERKRLIQQEEARRQQKLEAAQKLAEESEAKLKAEEKARQLAEQQRKAAQLRTIGALFSTVLIGIVAIFAINQRNQVQTLLDNANLREHSFAASGMSQLDALRESLKVGKKLKSDKTKFDTQMKAKPDAQMQILMTLPQIFYGIREENRFTGHEDTVQKISFSPDGQIIASASNDKTIKLWHRDGRLINTLNGHQDQVWGVSFSPDGKTIASASLDKTVKLWRASDGELMKTLPGHSNAVVYVSFSPDGKTIASASWDKTVKLWRASDGKLMNTLPGHSNEVNAVNFSPDGKIVASASKDKTVKLWRASDGKLMNTLKGDQGHSDEVWGVSFSPDGEIIASASKDNTVKLWKLDGSLINTLYGHTNTVNLVTFSPDGQTIASASQDFTVQLWKRDGTFITTLYGHGNAVADVSFDPDGQTIASASSDKTIKLWKYDQSLITTLTGHSNYVNDISFSPDGQMMASVSHDKTVKLWKRDGNPITILTGHQAEVWSVSFSHDGQTIASASSDKTVKLWRVSDGKLINTLRHTDQVYGVSFSRDGQKIASGSRDGIIKLWKRDGTPITILKKQSDAVLSVSFSPDGKTIASANGDKTVKLWKVSDGTLITTLARHGDRVTKVSFSSDGKMIASASGDGTVKLWNWDGTPIKTLTGYSGSVDGLSFSPNGEIIASTNSDNNTVKLWKVSDGSLIATFTGHSNDVKAVSFSPDGKTLASASDDYTVILWNLNLDDLLKRGCDWARVYLKNPNNGMSEDNPDRQICDDVQPSASFLVDRGRNLAQKGNIQGAVAMFKQALKLDPSLNFDPKAKALRFAASSLVAKGESLVIEGKVKEAIAAYKQAQKLDPTLKITADSLGNSLCWRVSLNGYAKDVMFACEKAVGLEPENGWIRDSRGVARALTGNNKGAIEDFEAFLKWADKNETYKESKPQRQSWINALKAGKNPLTPEEIKKLLN